MAKKQDLLFVSSLMLVVLPFVLSGKPYEIYTDMNSAYPFSLAALKFAVLATLGEMIGQRIKNGRYITPGFGVAARAILWGVYGVWIAIMMKVLAMGIPQIVESMGAEGVVEAMASSEITFKKFLGALSISVAMNLSFAPIFMTLHKITDTHILEQKGSIRALITPVPMRRIFNSLDWDVQWNFIFKKTIPLFWIPAHTVTFMLPGNSQVLFAAALSILLGVILSIGVALSAKKEKNI